MSINVVFVIRNVFVQNTLQERRKSKPTRLDLVIGHFVMFSHAGTSSQKFTIKNPECRWNLSKKFDELHEEVCDRIMVYFMDRVIAYRANPSTSKNNIEHTTPPTSRSYVRYVVFMFKFKYFLKRLVCGFCFFSKIIFIYGSFKADILYGSL